MFMNIVDMSTAVTPISRGHSIKGPSVLSSQLLESFEPKRCATELLS